MTLYQITLSRIKYLKYVQELGSTSDNEIAALGDYSSEDFHIIQQFLNQYRNDGVQLATNSALIRTSKNFDQIRLEINALIGRDEEVFITRIGANGVSLSSSSSLRFELEYLIEK